MKTLLLIMSFMLPISIAEQFDYYVVKANAEVMLYKAPWDSKGANFLTYLEEAEIFDVWEEYVLIEIASIDDVSHWYVHYSDVEIYKRKVIWTSPVLNSHIAQDTLPKYWVQDSLINISNK